MASNYKTEPSPFTTYQEAAEAIVSEFIRENIGIGPEAHEFRREYLPQIVEALEKDGKMPNRYEVCAINGTVPIDGSDLDEVDPDDPQDYGVPEEISAKFPNTDKLIGDQF